MKKDEFHERRLLACIVAGADLILETRGTL
jgi:hypothetical protein